MRAGSTPDPAMLEALGRLPVTKFLLTAAHGMSRNGMIITHVHQTAVVPPTVILSVPKGQPLSPLIRDSRAFALCELAEGDLLLNRLFNTPRELYGDDPFLGLLLLNTASKLPVPRSVASWIECELVRHLDIEADHEVYVGRAVGGGVLEQGRALSQTRTGHPGTDGRTEKKKPAAKKKRAHAPRRTPSVR